MRDAGPLDAYAASIILNGIEANRAKIARQSLEPVVGRLTAEKEAIQARVVELEGVAQATVDFLSGKDGAGFGSQKMDGSRFYQLAHNLRDRANQALKGGEHQPKPQPVNQYSSEVER